MTTGTSDILTVELGERAYPIVIGAGVLEELRTLLDTAHNKGTVGIVTDAQVGPLYADRVKRLVVDTGRSVSVHVMPGGEKHKRLERIEEICGSFLADGLDRTSIIIALGGGVVGDIAGFAAACFMRGIPFIQIPTTIVAQVDSSVGGKTGVNHPLSKNSIGAFHQPDAVLIDMALLQTLPDRELRAGLAEVIKHGVIADADLFAYMENESARILAKDSEALKRPILDSCRIKAGVVAADEKEHGLRANLNYGHTFGHAIEAVTKYETYLHGEAIAIGMHAAALLAQELGMVDAGFVARQRACIAAYGLPTTWPDLPVEETLAAMRKDKKVRSGTMKFILAEAMGRVVQRTDVPEDIVRGALDAVRRD